MAILSIFEVIIFFSSLTGKWISPTYWNQGLTNNTPAERPKDIVEWKSWLYFRILEGKTDNKGGYYGVCYEEVNHSLGGISDNYLMVRATSIKIKYQKDNGRENNGLAALWGHARQTVCHTVGNLSPDWSFIDSIMRAW